METAPVLPDCPDVPTRPPGPKQRLKTLKDLDRRTGAAKAAYTLRDDIITDLGGPASLSAMQRVLVDHVATLAAALGDMATKYLGGEDTNMVIFATLANAQRRLLADLGLERRALDVTPSLAAYVASKRHEPAPSDPNEDAEPDAA